MANSSFWRTNRFRLLCKPPSLRISRSPRTWCCCSAHCADGL